MDDTKKGCLGGNESREVGGKQKRCEDGVCRGVQGLIRGWRGEEANGKHVKGRCQKKDVRVGKKRM